jgi:hypothetical protein
MLLFRSEEHVGRWRERYGPAASSTLSLDQIAQLAYAWYARKLTPGWRRHTAAEAETLFAELGLDPEFWRLS